MQSSPCTKAGPSCAAAPSTGSPGTLRAYAPRHRPRGSRQSTTGRSLHVGLNMIFLVPGETGGMEVYARELVTAMRELPDCPRLTVFAGQAAAGEEWLRGLDVVTLPIDARNRVQWVRGEQQLLPGLARRAGVDLVHSL